MKSMMKLSALSSALALAGVMAISGHAVADTVTAKFTGMSETDGISYSVVLPPGSTNTATSGSTNVGIFNFDNTTPLGVIDTFDTDQFVSFCIDLEDGISNNNNVTWDVVALSGAPDANAGPMGQDKATDVAKVLTWALTNSVNAGSIDSTKLNDARFLAAAEKQAVQAVIWEVVHEDPTTAGYSLGSGTATFTGLTTGANSFAGDILSGFSSTTAMAGLVGLTNDGKQDFIGQVPIPAAAWLFGSALVGVAAVARRKKKEQEDGPDQGLIPA